MTHEVVAAAGTWYSTAARVDPRRTARRMAVATNTDPGEYTNPPPDQDLA